MPGLIEFLRPAGLATVLTAAGAGLSDVVQLAGVEAVAVAPG